MIKPLHDRVVVKRAEGEKQSKGGILLPGEQDKPVEGDVVSVGTGKILDDGSVRPLAVVAGDRILFGKYSGNEVKIDGEEYLVLREDDIMGIVQ